MRSRGSISIQLLTNKPLEKHAIAPSAARLCYAADLVTNHSYRLGPLEDAFKKSKGQLRNRRGNHVNGSRGKE
ncbi:MAG TPA: hypothetical protein VMZ30_22395 [Pyrinomonadaceae bacterium]|nr:hypothetical protein [Pyrinomonadaceae bacterium]